jgi:serine/threonine protein kinase
VRLCAVPLQMASALAHLHRHGVAHLDVKPDNIYLQDLPEEAAAAAAAAGGGHSGGGGGDGGGGGSCPGVRYKLGDFGQATRLDLKTPAAFDEGDCRWGGAGRSLGTASVFLLWGCGTVQRYGLRCPSQPCCLLHSMLFDCCSLLHTARCTPTALLSFIGIARSASTLPAGTCHLR